MRQLIICPTAVVDYSLFNGKPLSMLIPSDKRCPQQTKTCEEHKIIWCIIPDKSLVGGKVPKCIISTTKDTIIIVYFIPIDKKHCRL